MTENTKKLESFIPVPRKDISDFKKGVITRNELILYLWIRLNANPFGITSVSLSAITDDMFPSIKNNSVQKMLLSLRRKRFIYFDDHKGRRGSFEVHLDNFPTPKGLKTLENQFKVGVGLNKEPVEVAAESEVSQNSASLSQTFQAQKDALLQGFSGKRSKPSVRPSYNDTNTNTNTYSIDSKDSEIKTSYLGNNPSKISRRLSIGDTPINEDEDLVFEIVKFCEDSSADWAASAVKGYGSNFMRMMLGNFKDFIQTNPDIKFDSKGSYFNEMIQREIARSLIEKESVNNLA